jgi:hypothetical protein
MLIEVSASGVYIQTSAKVKPGDSLELEVGIPGSEIAIPMSVDVVRQKRVPGRLLTVAQGGIGARITNAPEAFYEYLLSLDPIVEEAELEPERSFQVRARQSGGPRTRRLFFGAADEDDAREAAVLQLGAGWEILELSEVRT